MRLSMSRPFLDDINETLSSEAADGLMQLIGSITHTTGSGTGASLQNIVRETVSDFFNGLISANDAARIIQSRAIIYLAEQQR